MININIIIPTFYYIVVIVPTILQQLVIGPFSIMAPLVQPCGWDTIEHRRGDTIVNNSRCDFLIETCYRT